MAARTVGFRIREWVDPSRTRWDGGGARPLLSGVWYPAADGAEPTERLLGPPDRPHFRAGSVAVNAGLLPVQGEEARPLVVLSHGTGGAAEQLGWLATTLAAAGFVVVAPNHHGNTAVEPYTAHGFLHFWERTRDLSVAIDRLLDDEVFGPAIDPGRIGAAGFSLGGTTVLSVAGARADISALVAATLAGPTDPAELVPPEFTDTDAFLDVFRRLPDEAAVANASHRDDRVRAVYAIAPAIGAAFAPAGLAPVTVPGHVVVGTGDELAPPDDNARHYAEHVGDADLTVLDDVGHYTFLAEPTEAGAEDLPLFCVDAPSVDRRQIHRTVADDARGFFRRHLA